MPWPTCCLKRLHGSLGANCQVQRIFRAPTIAALASVLEQPVLPHFSPFVRLKAGNDNPPILIAHGLGGHPNFFQLAKHIHTDHAIYGIQAKGIDGVEEPQDRIEDMARYYLDELNKFQPKRALTF